MLTISGAGEPKTNIRLTPEQGEELRELIEQETKIRFSSYCTKVGLAASNVYAYVGGRKKISFEVLQRLLSATDYTVECRTEFVIQKPDGTAVSNAQSESLESILFSEEMEQLKQDLKNGPQWTEQPPSDGATSTSEESPPKSQNQDSPDMWINPPSSSSSDLPLVLTKMLQDSPSKEQQEES